MSDEENLSAVTNAELAERVIAYSLKQFEVQYDEDHVEAYTKLYHAIHEIYDALRARGVEARRALLPLLEHKNAQVQLNAASELRDIEPARARVAYEYVAKWGPLDQAGPARMALDWLDKHPDNTG